MKNRIRFAELRQLLRDIGFCEVREPDQLIFRHEASDTLFVFRPYRPSDPVTDYNLIEVKNMLDSRRLMPVTTFENQFRKAPA
jgi:hypothetical protein